jgi:hypothetical protein
VPGLPAVVFGSDRIVRHEDCVWVDSAVEMPDWEFRDYRKLAVLFQGRRYFVAEKTPLPGGRYRYRLDPWPDDLTDIPGRTVEYDERYVAERDARLRRDTRNARAGEALSFVSPFLGLLPASVKLKLNDRYAYDPVTVTKQSLVLEYLVLMVLLALTVIDVFVRMRGATLFGGRLGTVLVVLILVAVDILVRRGRVESDAMEQPGFWEWALPRRRR